MLETIISIILLILGLALFFFLFKKLVKPIFKLVANAIIGVVILLLTSFFHLAPIGDLSVANVVICAIGGVFGAIVVIVLSFFGIVI